MQWSILNLVFTIYLSSKHVHLFSAGALLLEELVNSCGEEGIDAIVESAERRCAESQQEKVAGSTVWWRVRTKIIGFSAPIYCLNAYNSLRNLSVG